MTSAPVPAPGSNPRTGSGAQMIDWDLAVRIGAKLAGDGPRIPPEEAAAAVAELRAGAARSTGLVREFTGLDAPDDTAPVLVVDRPNWVQANAEAFSSVITPLADKLSEEKPPSGLTLAVGSRVTGAEVGALLGFLASKVLGQFDPFHPPHGRLLLVAPNIVNVEQELGVDPHDFRLWVCLHEETHRVQFTAVPWMRDHLQSLVDELSASVGPGGLDEAFGRVMEAVRAGARGGSLIDILSTPQQREILDRVTGMMSLLEGHADVVMDDVGPEVIGTVDAIRERFNRRRQGASSLDRLVRRLLGMEMKMAQYRDGAKFVRGVVDTVGMVAFNEVWARSDNLPTKAELSDHDAWIARVLG